MNTRSQGDEDFQFDSEITKRERICRRQARLVEVLSNQSPFPPEPDFEEDKREKEKMAEGEQTLKELANPQLPQQPLCITIPALNTNTNFELKSGLIHLLPLFHGHAGEDPHKHLKEFHVVCSSMKPAGITEEQIKLRAFPFSLKDLAKDWLYYLPSGTVETWTQMERLFLQKYFPASRVANIRKEICGVRQMQEETLHEYWERFKRLVASCPQHQISEQLLIQYFYEGLNLMDRSIIDAASGGALVDKTPAAAKMLISNMAANSQQFGYRDAPLKMMKEVKDSTVDDKLTELTSFVRKLATGNHHPIKPCRFCQTIEHTTDECKILGDELNAHANAIGTGNFQARKYDPYSNTYNSGWRDHPNLRYGNQ